MDKRIKEIKKEQRVALARIAYDLIMADNIIEDEEIAKYTKLFVRKIIVNYFIKLKN